MVKDEKNVPNTGIEPVAPGNFGNEAVKTRNVDPYTNSDVVFDWKKYS
jgi:hypothetical protein